MSRYIADARFRVGAVIGEGGHATVYEAFDRVTSQLVALKVLHERDEVAVARLEREARSLAAIRHPNVCAVLDCGRLDNGLSFVAMELLHGETLRSYLEARGRLDADEAIELGVQILAGLEAAHERGVVHRDIKPENVFLERREGAPVRVKLIDFGICRRKAVDERTLTLAGCIVGTPGYWAPEQAFGERHFDARTDLFAVGLVLYEVMTGRKAYERNNTQELARQLTRPLPSIRAVPSPAVASVIRMATEPDPRARYASASRFQHDLLVARTELRRERVDVNAECPTLVAKRSPPRVA
jgi:eukaryotic-like serine/threonine-protein kinase